MSNDTPQAPLDPEVQTWIEKFATAWEAQHGKRMDGRVLALLMITSEPHLAASDIARLLSASTGAVSTSTRALAEVGFITRVTLPGDRRHYFRTEDDVWGAFLLGERNYLRRMLDVMDGGLALEAGSDPRAQARLENGRRYMLWLGDYHRKMVEDWRAYRDGASTDEEDR